MTQQSQFQDSERMYALFVSNGKATLWIAHCYLVAYPVSREIIKSISEYSKGTDKIRHKVQCYYALDYYTWAEIPM